MWQFILFEALRGGTVSMLSHTYPHKLNWTSTITRLTAHFSCGLVSDLVVCKQRKSMIIHDTECRLLRCGIFKQHTLKLNLKLISFKNAPWWLHDMGVHLCRGEQEEWAKPAYSSINFICYTYNIQNKNTISESCIPKLKDDEDEGDVRTAEAILDFIELRSQAVDDANINHVIEYLCTSWFVYLGRWWDFFSFFSLLFVLCFYVLICCTCPLHVFCVLYVSMQNGDCE